MAPRQSRRDLLAQLPVTSVTAVTPHPPASTVVIRRMWSWPIMPVPMTPTLSVMCSRSFLFVAGGTP